MPIHNPVLRGSNPDPVMICVDGTYFLATSTFEWWPGVNLYQSTDLMHWAQLPSPIQGPQQLDLQGVPSSFGIWAPDLTYAHGKFWLVYSKVASVNASFTDVTNYLITAENITGPWSKPIQLNGVGFDASLFHDPNGTTYLVQQTCDFRENKPPFAGITLTKLDRNSLKPIPETAHIIWRGSEIGSTEGPHLYHKDGWYYLLCAEGGTSYDHQISVARSRSLRVNSFEPMPTNPLLTSKGHPNFPLAKQGHGSLVKTPEGAWVISYLCARPWKTEQDDTNTPGWCTLGRETAIQEISWTDNGWPEVVGGQQGRLCFPAPCETTEQTEVSSRVPIELAQAKPACELENAETCVSNEIEVPSQAVSQGKCTQKMLQPCRSAQSKSSETVENGELSRHFFHDDFSSSQLGLSWKTLRIPFSANIGSVGENGLVLRGRGSLCNLYECSLVARSWRDFSFDASTVVHFRPTNFQQMAGLVNYYGSKFWSWVFVTWDDERECRVIEVGENRNNTYTSYLCECAPGIPGNVDRIYLRTHVRTSWYGYDYSFDGENWNDLGVRLDARVLSDDFVAETGAGFFTGAYVGVAAVDMSGYGGSALFEFFDYATVQGES